MPALEHATVGVDAIGGEKTARGACWVNGNYTAETRSTRIHHPRDRVVLAPCQAGVEMPSSAALTGTQSAPTITPGVDCVRAFAVAKATLQTLRLARARCGSCHDLT